MITNYFGLTVGTSPTVDEARERRFQRRLKAEKEQAKKATGRKRKTNSGAKADKVLGHTSGRRFKEWLTSKPMDKFIK